MIRNIFLGLHLAVFFSCSLVALAAGNDTPLRVGTFVVDASPPVGSPLAYGRCDAVGMPLTARGIVLVGSGDPIVLCAVDWIGISNGGYERWRQAIAKAVQTSPQRVSVHSLHQHDAPRCDFSAERLLAEQGLAGAMFDVVFARAQISIVHRFEDADDRIALLLQRPLGIATLGADDADRAVVQHRVIQHEQMRFDKRFNVAGCIAGNHVENRP